MTELSVLDRLLLLGMLPAEGDLTTLRIVRQLREALSFSEAEHAALRLTSEGGRVTWDGQSGAALVKQVAIGHKAWGLIVQTLTTLAESKKLTLPQLDLYERFVEEPSGVSDAEGITTMTPRTAKSKALYGVTQ